MSSSIFITGASSGIGEAFAYALSKKGATLLLVARRKERLQKVAKRCQEKGAKAYILCCDLNAKEERSKLYSHVKQKFPPVEMLINNAGFGLYGRAYACSLEKEQKMIDLHCQVLLETVHAFVPSMIHRKRGYVINISSAAAFYPTPYMATYAATKAFMLHYSLALSAELRAYGIKVLCCCPGATKTEFQQAAGVSIEMPLIPVRSPELIATCALRDLLQGRWLSVPGTENQFFRFLSRLYPYPSGLKLAEKVLRRKFLGALRAQ